MPPTATESKSERTPKSTIERGKVTERSEPKRVSSETLASGRLHEALTVAAKRGLLSGSKTHMLRGRMPAALVAEAKLKSGISSDSKLLEAALANLALADDYAQWLFANRGTINPKLDLEF